MTKTILQEVTFPTTPQNLYDLYMDESRHGAAIGAHVHVSKRVGGTFDAWDGYCWGGSLRKG